VSFLDVYSDLLAGKTVNVEGKHIRIEDGRLLFPPVCSRRARRCISADRRMPASMSPSTPSTIPDMGEPPAQVAEKVNRVKAVAAARGRRLSFASVCM